MLACWFICFTTVCSKKSLGIAGTRYQQSHDKAKMALLVVEGTDGGDGIFARYDDGNDCSIFDRLDPMFALDKYRIEEGGRRRAADAAMSHLTAKAKSRAANVSALRAQ